MMFLSPYKNCWFPLVLALICFFFFVPHVSAQRRGVGNLQERPISFSIDTANFFDPESGTPRLEILYKVANDHLQFLKVRNGYQATFQVLCVVYDRKDRQVTGDVISDTQWARTYDQTNSRRNFARGHFVFSLPAGEYRLRVLVEDKNSRPIVSAEREASVPSFDVSSLMLSDLLLVDEIHKTEAETETLVKKGLFIVPSVNRKYSDLQPLLSFYFEIYDLSTEEPLGSFYEAVFEVADLSGEVVFTDSSTVLRQGNLTFVHEALTITSLEEGEHLLRLRVRDPETGRTAQKETPFTVRWSALGQVQKNYQEAIEQLRYIATDQEYRELKGAEGEERKEVWLKFWNDRDPTPGTPQNEMKEEYYRRIEYANAHFSVVSPGWKSDRGRVYILYGRPDEIERHPMEIGLKPYEIWHYYSSSHFFYFVDENGYGDYRLVSWR
jgi:GWxTD domain-containing protein